MGRVSMLLAVGALLAAPAARAEPGPAAGRLLVATEEIRGEIFAHAVILLLHYDESGAMGIVVNRPTDVRPAEIMKEPADLAGYRGTLYWGGPVDMAALRALLHADAPPDGAATIVDHVYLVPFDDDLTAGEADADRLRLYIGYAGWAPGQLESELAAGSWHVVAADEADVFADDPDGIWRRLSPAGEYRALSRPARHYAKMAADRQAGHVGP